MVGDGLGDLPWLFSLIHRTLAVKVFSKGTKTISACSGSDRYPAVSNSVVSLTFSGGYQILPYFLGDVSFAHVKKQT